MDWSHPAARHTPTSLIDQEENEGEMNELDDGATVAQRTVGSPLIGRMGVLIPGSSRPHAEVSLGKILNPKSVCECV